VWGEERLPSWCRAGGYDWVLASDVCYDSERFQPLLHSILQLAALNPETKVATLWASNLPSTLHTIVSTSVQFCSSRTVLRMRWGICHLLGPCRRVHRNP
jgi:Lysine methyltransferase